MRISDWSSDVCSSDLLRRHPDYRHDWLRRRRQPDAAGHWGLRLLEDPALDARDAHPTWFPDHDAVVQLYPDADPPPDAAAFAFWRIPGPKHLRSEEHTSELQSLMRISYAVFCLKKKTTTTKITITHGYATHTSPNK